jgi:hypothetical protein
MLFQVSFGNAEQDYPQKPISLIHGFGVGGGVHPIGTDQNYLVG